MTIGLFGRILTSQELSAFFYESSAEGFTPSPFKGGEQSEGAIGMGVEQWDTPIAIKVLIEGYRLASDITFGFNKDFPYIQ